jgi:hypothetical protein
MPTSPVVDSPWALGSGSWSIGYAQTRMADLRPTIDLQMVAWFTWDKAAFGWGSIEDDAGEPTQAALAYTQVYGWLVGATVREPCASPPGGRWTCALTRPGGYHALAVWNTLGPRLYTPSGTDYVDYRTLAGNVVRVAPASVPIGAKPILLETLPTHQLSLPLIASQVY